MRLRAWQSACIARALDSYCTKKHFLCLATPGAGKSTMAAELALRLFEQHRIDFIFCFAPSLTVVSGLANTFERCFGRRFDGLVGAIGGAYTYQGMRTLGDEFWATFESHRILVVFDEIHHCSGNDLGGANSWGQEILSKIQHRAAYTLALTGTPWRSDSRPIVLAEYSDPEGEISCDYIYGLKEAIRDQVCRKPSIVLVDNDRLKINGENDYLEFAGLSDLFSRSNIRYQQVLHNDEALRFCLALGCKQLEKLRHVNPEAGGLVVTSSVAHAEMIAKMLRSDFNKSAVAVTYQHKDSASIIDSFRMGSQEWIVSVGMISEGTDIPRLQVCCHFSRITTELYFRQVLGRVLRMTETGSSNAWLYTFAEPQLIEYAHRISDELPYDGILSFESFSDISLLSDSSTSRVEITTKEDTYQTYLSGVWLGENVANGYSTHNDALLDDQYSVKCLGKFQQKLVELTL